MADPFRLRVVKKITDWLEGTQTEDSNSNTTGYNFTLAGAVFRGRGWFSDDDPLPMVSILETPIAAEQLPPPPEGSTVSTGDWDLLIQGFVKDDTENPTDEAYLLSADVIKRLAEEKARVSELKRATGQKGYLFNEPKLLDLFIGSPVHRPADEVSAKTYFWLQIRLRIAENLEDPYT